MNFKGGNSHSPEWECILYINIPITYESIARWQQYFNMHFHAKHGNESKINILYFFNTYHSTMQAIINVKS